MEVHLTDEDRNAGWRIPAYDNGVFVGYVNLIFIHDVLTKRYEASARFERV